VLLHLRITVPEACSAEVLELLGRHVGVVHLVHFPGAVQRPLGQET
jgi:hypothetical protein